MSSDFEIFGTLIPMKEITSTLLNPNLEQI